MTSTELLKQGVDAARAGRKAEARTLLIQAVEIDPQNEMAWIWLSGLMEDLEDRIIACENALTINPANVKVRTYLDGLLREKNDALTMERQKDRVETDSNIAPIHSSAQRKPEAKSNPYSLALQLEQDGKLDEALDEYKSLAARTKRSADFDFIYKQIVRIEGLQKENIQYVPPSTSVWRLTLTWPLVYLSFAFVQVGLNPFLHSRLYMWLSFPWVVLGSFALSLSEIRVRHVVWQKIFLEDGDGSTFARVILAIAGWLFVLIPFVLLILDSLSRLRNFQIPPEPFFR